MYHFNHTDTASSQHHASLVDETLPMLPGKVGPTQESTTEEALLFWVLAAPSEASQPLTETVALPRLEFPTILHEVVQPTPEPTLPLGALVEYRTSPAGRFEGWTKARLYARAKDLGLPGRSKLNKAELCRALLRHEGALRAKPRLG